MDMRQSSRFWLCACVVAVLLLIEVTATRWATAQSKGFEVRTVKNIFEFRPGVIVNSNQSTVYLMNLQRGIDAVDLSSGKLLWSTTNAARPLLLDGRRLVAQAESAAPGNRFRIVVLDAQDAGKLLLETTVQLPKDVKVAIDDALGTTFHTSARLHEDKVVISWQYSEREISGAQLGPNANVRVTAGAVRIDLKTGHTDTLRPDQVTPIPETQLPDNVARLIKLGTLPEPLWQVGNVLGAIERTRVKGEQRTILRRWDSDTGRPMPEVVLFDAELTFRYTSADGRHLLASKRLDSDKTHWGWRIYSLETGKQAAEVRNTSPAAWFFITASSLILEVPPTGGISNSGLVIDQPFRLRAIKLETSNELWEWPFRDTAYRGPHPPRLTRGSRTP
jgi:hypothetical protein